MLSRSSLNLVWSSRPLLSMKRIERLAARALHGLAQFARLDDLVALEDHVAQVAASAFDDREGDRAGIVRLVEGDVGLERGVVVALVVVVILELLTVLFDHFLVQRAAFLGGDFLLEPPGAEVRVALEHHLLDDRLGGDDDDDLDPAAGRFAEDAHVGNLARAVERADVFLHVGLVERLADGGAHVGEDALAGDGGAPDVLHLDLLDDGARGHDLRLAQGAGSGGGEGQLETQRQQQQADEAARTESKFHREQAPAARRLARRGTTCGQGAGRWSGVQTRKSGRKRQEAIFTRGCQRSRVGRERKFAPAARGARPIG